MLIQDFTFMLQNLNRDKMEEKSKYYTMRSWIHYDEPNRKSAIRELLSLIDLQKLPRDFLEKVVATDPLVKDDNQCLKDVTSAITKQFTEMKQKERGSKLISVGGFANPCKVIEIYNFFDFSESVYPDLPSPTYCSKSLELNGYIYSIGGSSESDMDEDTEITNKVYRINFFDSEMIWEEVCSLNEGRCAMGGTVFNDCLVVAGGIRKTDDEFLLEEEFYNPALNKWQQFLNLNQERIFNELVSCDGCLFALGGHDEDQCSLFSMEKLSDLDGEWEEVEAMNEPRQGFAAVNCQGEIYAIGGKNKTSEGEEITLKSVEKYIPVKKQWRFVTDMNTERFGLAACVLQDKIYVAGGVDANNDPVKTIECYNQSHNKWTVAGETENELFLHSLIVI